MIVAGSLITSADPENPRNSNLQSAMLSIALPCFFLIAPSFEAAESVARISVTPRVAHYSLVQDAIPAAGFDRDADLARKLAANGYKTQADWLIAKLKSAPGITETQKAELAFVEASNLIELFASERDFEKSRAIYESAKKTIGEFIKIAPKGESLIQANYQNGDLDRRFGEKIIEQIKREPNAEKAAALRTEGEKVFASAIKYFAERADELKRKADEESRDLKEDREYQVAAYAVPQAYLSAAYLYPAGDQSRTTKLQNAESRFEQYCTDAPEGTMAYFDANVKWGNARRDLGRTDAVDCYSQALELLYYRDANNEKFPLPPNDADLTPQSRFLIIEAVTEASRMWNAAKEYDQVIQYYTDVRTAMPQLETAEGPRALELIYEAARAYDESGKKDQAKIEAKRIVKSASPDMAVAQEARELLIKLGESVDSSEEVTLVQVVGAIERQLKDSNFPEAIRAFQQARDRWRGTVAEKKFWGDLLLRGAISYQNAGRALEANLLFSEIGEKFPQHRDAPKALLASVLEACKVWKTTKAEWGGALAQEGLDRLQSQFADAPETQDAQQLFLQTQQLVGGKKQIELAKIGEEQLKGLSKTEPKFGRIVYETAMRYYRAGVNGIIDPKQKSDIAPSREGAERCFDMYLEWVKAQQTLDPVEIAKMEERSVGCLLSKAEMWLWEPGSAVEKTLAFVQQLQESASKSNAAKAKASDIEKVKMRAYLKQNKLDAAVQVADGMYVKDPASPKTSWMLKKIADVSFDMMKAAEKDKEKDPKKRESLADTALKFYKNWVVASEKQSSALGASDYNFVATRLFQLGLVKNNVDRWPGNFYGVDPAKFPYLEPAQLSAELYQKAVAANEAAPSANFDPSEARYRRGQVLGLLLKWKEVVADYEQIARDDGIIDEEGRTLKVGGSRRYKPEALANDLAWAYAQLAAQGSKDAGKMAQKYSSFAINYAMPKSSSTKLPFDVWYARYTLVYSMVKNGERSAGNEQLAQIKATDRDYDAGEFGFKAKFEALEAQLK